MRFRFNRIQNTTKSKNSQIKNVREISPIGYQHHIYMITNNMIPHLLINVKSFLFNIFAKVQSSVLTRI